MFVVIGVDGVNWGGVGSVCEIGSICSVCEIGSICECGWASLVERFWFVWKGKKDSWKTTFLEMNISLVLMSKTTYPLVPF